MYSQLQTHQLNQEDHSNLNVQYNSIFQTKNKNIQDIEQDKIQEAVNKIQRFAKWILQRRKQRHKRMFHYIMDNLIDLTFHTIQVKSVLKIQSFWRGYQKRKQYKQIKQAARIIYRALSRYLKQKANRQYKAACVIQGFYKMITFSRLYQKIRHAAIIIQRNYRAHLWEIAILNDLYKQYVLPMEETLQQTKTVEANALWTIGCDPNSEFQQTIQQEISEDLLSLSLLDKCIQSYRPRLNKMCLFLYPIDLHIHCDLNDQYNPNFSYSRTLLNLIVQQILRDHPIQTIHLTEQSTLCITLGGSSIYEFGTALFFAPHDEESQLQVQKLILPDHIKIKTLSTSDTHLLMITADGSLLQFGEASKPQGQSIMLQPYNIRSFVVCATNYASYAISDNNLFKLNQKIPQKIQTTQQVKTCCAGLNFAAILCRNGTIYTWGENFEGELGQGDTRVRFEPTLVQTLSNERIVQLSCGLKHMSARSSLNRVYTWGWGQYGQLGIGSLVNITLPQQVLNKYLILWAVCGRTQTLVITAEFTIMCAGTNSIIKEQCLFEPFPLSLRSKALDNPNYIPIRIISTYSKSLELTYITYANITTWLEDNHNKRSKVLKKLIRIWSESNDWASVDPPFHQSISNHIYEGSMRKIQPDHNPKVGLYFLRQQQQYRDEQKIIWEKRKKELIELLRRGIKNAEKQSIQIKSYTPIQHPLAQFQQDRFTQNQESTYSQPVTQFRSEKFIQEQDDPPYLPVSQFQEENFAYDQEDPYYNLPISQFRQDNQISKQDNVYYQIPVSQFQQEHQIQANQIIQEKIKNDSQQFSSNLFQQDSLKQYNPQDSFRESTQLANFSIEAPQHYPGPLFKQNSSKKGISSPETLLDSFRIKDSVTKYPGPLFKQESSKQSIQFEEQILDQYGSFSGVKQQETTREDKLVAIKKHLIKIQELPNYQVTENDIQFLNRLHKSKQSAVLLEILEKIQV